MTLSLEFVGHASLRLDLDGVRLLTDPALREHIGPLRRVAPPIDAAATWDGVDVALISHLHWDHLDLPSLRDAPSGATIVVPWGAGDWLRSATGREDVREVLAGDRIEVGGVTVTAVPALHAGFRPPRGPAAAALGYVVEGSRTVYFAGDTELFEGMRDVHPAIDLALIPVWGWGPTLGRGLHMDPVRAARSLRLLRPRAAVPIHWGTYWPRAMGRVYSSRLIEPPAAFVEYAHELVPDVHTIPTEVGELVTATW